MSGATPQRFGDVLDAGGWILAFDTAEDFGSVAVLRATPEGIAEPAAVRTIDERRQQAALLVPTLHAALEEAGVSVAELAAVIVGAGPGSFTGVRIAAATAKGLVFGQRIPLWTPSSLLGAAMDPTWAAESAPRAVAFDARGDRVYAAIVEADGVRPPAFLMEPKATTIQEFLANAEAVGAVTAGSAVRRHLEQRPDLSKLPSRGAPTGDPSALGLVACLALDPGRLAADNPRDFEPTYLRGSSAEPSQPK